MEQAEGFAPRYQVTTNPVGLPLHTIQWEGVGDEASRPSIILLHGFGDYTGRHLHVASHLAQAGWSGVMWDLAGHGRSGGRRGDIEDYGHFLSDISTQKSLMKPGKPVVLLGFSFGAQLAVSYLLAEAPADVIGSVLVAPWFRLSRRPPTWKWLLGRVALMSFPGFRQRTTVRRSHLSTDPNFLDAIDADRLTHPWISARMFFFATENGERCIVGAPQFRWPVSVLHGVKDPVTSAEAARVWVERVGSQRKRFQPLPGTLHEPHNDLQRAAFLRQLCSEIAWVTTG